MGRYKYIEAGTIRDGDLLLRPRRPLDIRLIHIPEDEINPWQADIAGLEIYTCGATKKEAVENVKREIAKDYRAFTNNKTCDSQSRSLGKRLCWFYLQVEPHVLWAVKTDDGCIITDTIAFKRSTSKSIMEHLGWNWNELHKEGYRIVKVRVEEAK